MQDDQLPTFSPCQKYSPSPAKDGTRFPLFCRTAEAASHALIVSRRRLDLAQLRVNAAEAVVSSLPEEDKERGEHYLQRCRRDLLSAEIVLDGATALGEIDFGRVWISVRALQRCKYLTYVERTRLCIWLDVGFHTSSGRSEVARLNQMRMQHLFDLQPRFRSVA